MNRTSGHSVPSDELLAWRLEEVARSRLRRREAPLGQLRSWVNRGGRIAHESGRFFAIAGLAARSSAPCLNGTSQPIIHQPEIGLLGFLLRRRGGRPELLVQAKAEPGNVETVQFAPTVQATQSNYTRVHGGAPTPYLEWFQPGAPGRLAANVRQSEQGTRFLEKFNRNATVAVDGTGPEPAGEAWRWCDASLLLDAIRRDYCVNTDARSVLACSDWAALAPGGRPFERWRGRGGFGEALLDSLSAPASRCQVDDAELRERLRRERAHLRLRRRSLPLEALDGWEVAPQRIVDHREAEFAVQGVQIAVETREVAAWDQPLVRSLSLGRIDLVCQQRQGVLHFLLRISREIGLRGGAEFGPTLQRSSETPDPFASKGEREIAELVSEGSDIKEHAGCLQSDEGGRFDHSVARYRVLELAPHQQVSDDPALVWTTLGQLQRLLSAPGWANNELRSALSLVLAFL